MRKQLAFGEEGSLSKKMAPSTPGGVKPPPFGLVDISDSEDELANTNVNMPHFKSQVNGAVCVSRNFSSGDTLGNESNKTSDDYLKRTLFDQSDEEDMSGYNGNFPVVSTPKRKRASNIVTTDSESDDDNVPICKLRTKHPRELNHDPAAGTTTVSKEKISESAATPRRRLVTLRKCNIKNVPERSSPCNSNDSGTNYYSRIPTNECAEDDVPESDTEDESLGGFIVKSSDVSDSDDDSSASEDLSDDNVDFGEVLSSIRRQGNSKLKWDFEADMLAAFGKDLTLCMKAVCALYRQQTSEEKISKGTLYYNQRGFSHCDAFRYDHKGIVITNISP